VAWIDSNRTYIVNGTGHEATRGTIVIAANPELPPHHYSRRGNTLRVRPAVVQSFAAAFIADDLKGTAPPNGRR
jgi:hypothetical protein